MPTRQRPVVVRIADEYTTLPGPRYREQGAHSGEQLREELLQPRLEEAMRGRRTLIVDLRGTSFGYPIGFLEETFGGLARNVANAADHMHMVDDNQETMREIVQLMRNAQPAGAGGAERTTQ